MHTFTSKILQRVLFFGKILQRVLFFWENSTTCRIFLGKFYNVFYFTRDEKIKKTDLEGVFVFKKTSFYSFYSVKTTNFAPAIQF